MFASFISAIVTSIFFSSCFCSGSDTISTGQSILPNQTIVSKQGKFELGFFTPGNSANYYVGIWYKNILNRTVVWVANRNNPIPFSTHNNSRLQMSNGNLYIHANMETIWESKGTSSATDGLILDTGNFVLRNASGIIVWQSFDYPTDTWLPGARVGFRWFTDIEAKLVSWKNPNDPGFGDFSLGMDENGGSELFITRNNDKLWRSGAWHGGTFTSSSDHSHFSNFSYVSRDGNVYLTYNVYNESVMSRIVLGSRGLISNYVWTESLQAWVILWMQPSDNCRLYNICGLNGVCDINSSPLCSCLLGFVPRSAANWSLGYFSGGCQRIRPVECGGGKAGFRKANLLRLPANPESLQVKSGICELACSDNCSCNAYAFDSGRGCLLFMGDMLDLVMSQPFRDNSTGEDLYIRMDSVERPRNGKKNELVVALGVPITAAILLSCFCSCYCWRKLKRKENKEEHQNLLLLDLVSNEPAHNKNTPVGNSLGGLKSNQYELPIFSFSSIAASTDNFSVTNKLGEGGFGPVYKGELLNKQFVAVKRLSARSGQGLEEFKNETELIAKLQHRNLVGILGCCIENNEKILVYEFMPNKSLDFFVFDPSKKEILDWKKRVRIIEGIAQGLLYLHHHSRLRIVHRDLKASNILLDAEMNPKISDFGLARIFGGNYDSQANTKRIVGTYGYMSPEYAMEGLFSVKSDVFAFGVLMLEIISGKKNTGFYGSVYLSLLGYAWNLWKHGTMLELVDPTFEIPDSSSSTPLRYIQIGLLCVQENPADRPLMSDVIAMLNNEETAIASPKHPAFTVGRTLAKARGEEGGVEFCSINELTVSDIDAR